jgi:hypothetical protein
MLSVGAKYLRVAVSVVAVAGLLVPSSDALARAGSGSSSSRGSSSSSSSRGTSGSSGSSGTHGTGGSSGTRLRRLHPLPGGGYGYDSGSPIGSGGTVTPSNVAIPKISTGPNWGLILGLGLGLGIPALIGIFALIKVGAARRAQSDQRVE